MTGRQTTLRVWRLPLAIGLVSAGGLLFALLGDGAADALSWAALGVPVALSGWVLWPRGPET
ncbi:MAG: hypothetical protein R3314_10150 [Longimicrobiales bacterium]|nr:hypothetical protein [Longimicrobiales bacterium]